MIVLCRIFSCFTLYKPKIRALVLFKKLCMFALVKVMEVERRQALVFDAQQDIYFIMSKCPVFVKTDGVLYCEPPIVLKLY